MAPVTSQGKGKGRQAGGGQASSSSSARPSAPPLTERPALSVSKLAERGRGPAITPMTQEEIDLGKISTRQEVPAIGSRTRDHQQMLSMIHRGKQGSSIPQVIIPGKPAKAGLVHETRFNPLTGGGRPPQDPDSALQTIFLSEQARQGRQQQQQELAAKARSRESRRGEAE